MRKVDEIPQLPAVQAAVWDSQRLRIMYRGSDGGEARERIVDPYGLVAKAGVWYLIAGDRGDARLYRVSRMESAETTGESARRPAGLDLEALWELLRRRIEERGPGVGVRLRVRQEALERVLRVTASQLVGPAEREAEDRGSTVLTLPFVAEGAARGALLGFGLDVEVLAPASLRAEMRAVARAVADLYSEPGLPA